MRALAALSDEALLPLVVGTNVSGSPAAKLAPRFWRYLGDVLAFEVARRPELRRRLNLEAAANLEEPAFPQDIPTEELELAGMVLLALAEEGARGESADDEGRKLEAALHEVAEGLLMILRDRLAKPTVH